MYNRFNKHKPFVIIFEKQLERLASAVRIQLWWKGVQERKRLIRFKDVRMDTGDVQDVYQRLIISEKILVRRAVVCMQQWWKNRKIRLRMKALTDLNKYIHHINDRILYLEENIYLKLESIIYEVKNHQTFLEQNLHFDIKDHSVKAIIDPRFDKINRYSEYALPFWLLLNLYIIR